jgi:1-acyl-sn-glycerol-3-phosphate acyltransferase
MQRTLFDTPVVNTVLRGLSRAVPRTLGWQVQGSLPSEAAKSVLIAAPHTSNWDLPYTLMATLCLRLRVYWMGKASLFRGPFGPVMRWLRGIPVDRSKNNNLVASAAAAIIAAKEPLQLVVSPKGPAARRDVGRRASISLHCRRRCQSCLPIWTMRARSVAWVRRAKRRRRE